MDNFVHFTVILIMPAFTQVSVMYFLPQTPFSVPISNCYIALQAAGLPSQDHYKQLYKQLFPPFLVTDLIQPMLKSPNNLGFQFNIVDGFKNHGESF